MALRAIRRALRGGLPPAPIDGAADVRWSVISSAHDLYRQGNDDLVAVGLAAASEARTLPLLELQARSDAQDAEWVRTWPGEHYRLLAALTRVIAPVRAVEIGTFRGHGALALAAGSTGTQVVTYDLVPWRTVPGSALREEDFATQVEQRLGDLGDAAYLRTQLETLRSSDLIFIDGPKDGRWEQAAVPMLLSRLTDRRRLVVLDDIRLLEMVQLWRDLPHRKLDMTSFGHWSGTGFLYTA